MYLRMRILYECKSESQAEYYECVEGFKEGERSVDEAYLSDMCRLRGRFNSVSATTEDSAFEVSISLKNKG
jgi:plastocyanin domain-containing protein